jgi:hypothetical protein
MNDERVPYVFLLDLDGTIQGDISPQCKEFNLLKSLKIGTTSKKIKQDYLEGLIRPYFVRFINLIKEHFTGKVQLFIYTASDTKWANHIIPIIESIIKFKFNRPFFTRKHCSMEAIKIKSLENVRKYIYLSLKLKNNVLNDRIFLIDNNNVIEDKHLLKCSTYNFVVTVDTLRDISLKNQLVHYNIICKRLFNRSCSSRFEMYKLIYDDAYKRHIRYDISNKIYLKDDYWKRVTNIMFNHRNNINKGITYLKDIR